MFAIFFLLAIVSIASGNLADLQCRYERDFAISCAMYYVDGIVDGVKDNQVSLEEIAAAKDKVLTKFEKGGSNLFASIEEKFGVGETEEQMINNCDTNANKLITKKEVLHNEKCIYNCMMVNGAVDVVCRRMTKKGDDYFDELSKLNQKHFWNF